MGTYVYIVLESKASDTGVDAVDIQVTEDAAKESAAKLKKLNHSNAYRVTKLHAPHVLGISR